MMLELAGDRLRYLVPPDAAGRQIPRPYAATVIASPPRPGETSGTWHELFIHVS
jgi:hypothetical protein